jgi:hypothetical protein
MTRFTRIQIVLKGRGLRKSSNTRDLPLSLFSHQNIIFSRHDAEFINGCNLWSLHSLGKFANETAFPNEQTGNGTQYLTEAASLSKDPRLYQYFMDQCIVQQVYPQLFGMPSGYVKLFEAFDNFYFVRHTGVSAWA